MSVEEITFFLIQLGWAEEFRGFEGIPSGGEWDSTALALFPGWHVRARESLGIGLALHCLHQALHKLNIISANVVPRLSHFQFTFVALPLQ